MGILALWGGYDLAQMGFWPSGEDIDLAQGGFWPSGEDMYLAQRGYWPTGEDLPNLTPHR